MISINDLTVSYGSWTLLDHISFHISENDKIGLVGKNGCGKSTLMKLIVGEQNPTSGCVDKPSHFKIGYLPQIMSHNRGRSVIEETMTVFDEIKEMEAEMDSITQQLAERTDYESAEYLDLISSLNEINDRLAVSHSEPPEVQATRTLLGLGFKDEELSRKTETFSQGWNMRIELAKVLLGAPDVLLLDEPTNHLDVDAKDELKRALKAYKGSILMVCHEPEFYEGLATAVWDCSKWTTKVL